jgi:hypothetical protein
VAFDARMYYQYLLYLTDLMCVCVFVLFPIVRLGWKPEENLCIFKLNIHDGKILPPELIRFKSLTGPLMKAVTSAKLSPTGAYALVGYGVRNRGVVEDHPCRYSKQRLCVRVCVRSFVCLLIF